MSNIWSSCLCGISTSSSNNNDTNDPIIGKNVSEKLSNAILKSDYDNCQQLIRRIKSPHNFTLTVKRRQLRPTQCFAIRSGSSSEPFVHFYQQSSPLLWAIDCQQWKIVGQLNKAGFDTNRPQTCIRWTSLSSPGSSAKCATTPYKKFWSRGRYTYQSCLDYYFASVFETLSSELREFPSIASPTALTTYFSHLPELLSQGVDVHRLDSVIVFNQLACSFDRYLAEFNDETGHIFDIPESDKTDNFVELNVVKELISNGFSEFECMEFLSPCFNWFGLLLCLVCHPKLSLYSNGYTLPRIIREAALLIINLLAIQFAFPTPSEFEDNLENLQLRKLYTKRYLDSRIEFNTRLQNLRKECLSPKSKVMSLKLITRNVIRRQIGGIRFCEKVRSLPLPQSLLTFLQYIDVEHFKAFHVFPLSLVNIGSGINIYSLPSEENGTQNSNTESVA